jgi:hypothetical protein
MRSRQFSINALLTIVIAVSLPGCLSLGGKTVYTSDSPQNAERMSSLEQRVSVLEQAVGSRQAAPSPPALH